MDYNAQRQQFNVNDIKLFIDTTELDAETLKLSTPDIVLKQKLHLEITEKTIPEPVACKDDPLGASMIPSITNESNVRSEYQMKYLGSQASFLVTSQARIEAWKYLTTSINISMSRVIILNILSQLGMHTNSTDLINSLKTIGLSDICKVVRLMRLVAMNRVEICSSPNLSNCGITSSYILKNFSQLVCQAPAASGYLNNLCATIAALAQSDAESSKLIVDMCTKDLIHYAVGCFTSNGFAVTQALVNVLSMHGGSSLMELSSLSPVFCSMLDSRCLTLENGLSAYILINCISNGDREWAAEQLFKCIATKFKMLGEASEGKTNFADLSNSIDQKTMAQQDGHDNRVTSLAWFEPKRLLASSGYDGTVRIWQYQPESEQLSLQLTFVFHESMDVYGSELQDKLIDYPKWSPMGDYVAAAMGNIVNVWLVDNYNEQSDLNKDWFIDDQDEFITCIAWPKQKNAFKANVNYLLVGRIDGNVSLICVYRGHKKSEVLHNCSLCRGKFYDIKVIKLGCLF